MSADIKDALFPVAVLIIVGCIIEGALTDAGDAVRNTDFGQTGAILKGGRPDIGHIVRNIDGVQTRAATERRVIDGCHAVGDCDACNLGTSVKCGITDRGYRQSVVCGRDDKFRVRAGTDICNQIRRSVIAQGIF